MFPPVLGPLHSFFRRLTAAFGWRYVAAVVLTYGVNQGMGEALLFSAVDYFLIDVLKYDAARAEIVQGFARIPWQSKALFGLASDLFPIHGYHRAPYMMLASCLGALGNLCLCLLTAGAPLYITAMLLLLGNLNFALPDVMIDATVAERAKVVPARTADMQALCWGSLFALQIPMSLSTGYMLATAGPRLLLGLSVVTATCVGVPAGLGWLGEKRRAGRPGLRGCCESAASVYCEVTGTPSKRRVVRAAALVGTFSISLATIQLTVGDKYAHMVSVYNVGGGLLLVLSLYAILRRVDETLARAVCFVFLKNALCPRSRSLLFDWQHAPSAGSSDWRCYDAQACANVFDAAAAESLPVPVATFTNATAAAAAHSGALECGWARGRELPCLSPVLRSWVAIMGAVAGLAGTALYTTYFQRWTFRRIIGLCQLLLVLANALDLIWVLRINVALGIPDAAFAFGEEAFIDVFDQIQSQAFFIFAAKLCPRDVEASMFALFMGLSNFGYDVGRYSGAGLIAILDVQRPDFDGIAAFMLIKAAARLLPLMCVPFLVPRGTPADTAEEIMAMGAGRCMIGVVTPPPADVQMREHTSCGQGGFASSNVDNVDVAMIEQREKFSEGTLGGS